jgi:hypothetical protein
MKGMKALEYRIWSRSNLIRKIRLIRLDKNFHVKYKESKN